MYGGLFGDLPATKEASKNESKCDANNNPVGISSGAGPHNPEAETTVEKPLAISNEISVARQLGISSSTVAFVPTAMLQRRRNTKRPAFKPMSGLSTRQTDLILELTNPSANNGNTSGVQTLFVDVKGNLEQSETVGTIGGNVSESNDLRLLHEQAKKDAYDPYVPNDLLQYWEHLAVVAERERLELERIETIEEQRRLRLQLERERSELEKKGDIKGLVELRTQRGLAGSGRGRGVSNLPAWLVEQRKSDPSNSNGTKN